IDSLFDILYEFLQDDFEYKRVAISSILITMVSRVISEMSRKIKEPSSPSAQRSRKDVYFKEFMLLLSEHYKQERSVGFYAEKMFITPKYLSGIIKDVSGKSAAEWIDHYVVMEAKNLIKYSGLNIQEVAYALNFPNQSFFGKFFKRLSGMSPSEYKNL
ncbi:MAG: helix-turn-helix domain-containing protein, partial [Bacteroidia bacterium]|nr:helix-turn-helix domain-containing protein [Bacteroidia bacterium]